MSSAHCWSYLRMLAASARPDRIPLDTLQYGPMNLQEERAYTSLTTGQELLPVPLAIADSPPASPSSSPRLRPTWNGDDPLSFLPPVPDLSATQETQTVVEDESGRTIKRARRALEAGGGIWQTAAPYADSTLAEAEGRALPSVELIAEDLLVGLPGGADKVDEEELLGESSLLYFLETYNYVALDPNSQEPAQPLRHSRLRRRAAAAIHSNILIPADDSLSGAVPTPQARHAKKQAGWIPYPPLSERPDASEASGKAIQPIPSLHPFTTMLPPTVAETVPSSVLPHSTRVLAPPMHPRYPIAHSQVRTLFEPAHGGLFHRATRVGPPGPLLENGAAAHYEIESERPNIPNWPGDTQPRMMSWNFEWDLSSEYGDGVKDRSLGASTPSGGIAFGSASAARAGPAFPQLPARQPLTLTQRERQESAAQLRVRQQQERRERQERKQKEEMRRQLALQEQRDREKRDAAERVRQQQQLQQQRFQQHQQHLQQQERQAQAQQAKAAAAAAPAPSSTSAPAAAPAVSPAPVTTQAPLLPPPPTTPSYELFGDESNILGGGHISNFMSSGHSPIEGVYNGTGALSPNGEDQEDREGKAGPYASGLSNGYHGNVEVEHMDM